MFRTEFTFVVRQTPVKEIDVHNVTLLFKSGEKFGNIKLIVLG